MSDAKNAFLGLCLSATLIYCCSESVESTGQEPLIELWSLPETAFSNAAECSTAFPAGSVLSDRGVMTARTVDGAPDTHSDHGGYGPGRGVTQEVRDRPGELLRHVRAAPLALEAKEPSHYLPTIYLMDSLLLLWRGATLSDYCTLPANSPDSFLSEAVGLHGTRGPLMTKLIEEGGIPLDDGFYALLQQRFPHATPLLFRGIDSGDALLHLARIYRNTAIDQGDIITLTLVQSALNLIASLPGEPETVRTAARREGTIGADDRLRAMWRSLPRITALTYFGGAVAQWSRPIALSRSLPLLRNEVVLRNLGAELAGSGAQLAASGVASGQIPTSMEFLFSLVHSASVALTRLGPAPQWRAPQLAIGAQARGPRPPSSIGTTPGQQFYGGKPFPRVQKGSVVYVYGHVNPNWQMVGFDGEFVDILTIANTITRAGGVPIILGCRAAALGLTGPIGLIPYSAASRLMSQAAGKSYIGLLDLFKHNESWLGNSHIAEKMFAQLLVTTPSSLPWRSMLALQTSNTATHSAKNRDRHVGHRRNASR